MNMEMESAPFAADGHPQENYLLLALEHELPADQALQVERHLGNCWNCRARSEEMRRGILAFVEYREKRYLPSLPEPPHDHRDFAQRLRNLTSNEEPAGLLVKTWRRLGALVAWPGRIKWVSMVAAATAVLVFWVQVLFNPAAISATELLSRAAVAQNPPTAPERRGGLRRKAHQKVRIRGGGQTVIRDFAWTAGQPIPRSRWDRQPDPLQWDSPLTASGFAEWRGSMQKKTDKVQRSGGLLTLDTTAIGDLVTEASLTVRSSDFHPVAQHLRFSDNRQLDFDELAFEIHDEELPPAEAGPSAQSGQDGHAKSPDTTPDPSASDLVEAELLLRYAMFANQWDLGEDLNVTRAQGRIAVSGTASSPERAASMQVILGKLPNVQLSIAAPAAAGHVAAVPDHTPRKSTAPASAPLLQETMDRAFASREERLAFVDRCLSVSDIGLSHAWALKRLVERYGDADEQLLKPDSLAKFREMLRAHLQEIGRANHELEPLFELLPPSDSPATPLPATWRARVLSLFNAVQQQDRLVTSLVAGPEIAGQNLTLVSANLRLTHTSIAALLDGLKELSDVRR